MVFVDRPPALLPADSVMADNQQGAVIAVRHLINHGHRRIAFLGRPDLDRHRRKTATPVLAAP